MACLQAVSWAKGPERRLESCGS
ncbi:uncharacterized protein G2W53_025477 [Senna tora]|uniref:Uncharacterized protein n=1 Tax=Senna tora TaxID=362788 RepID=A0A834TF81_9FABA|nr:uncharacterized protein G2W53_025477 [Senna tora]